MFKKYEDKDMAKYAIIENKSSVILHGVHPGKRKKLEIDKNGNPLDYRWRRRLKDSKIDSCIEIVADMNKPEKNEEA